MVTIEVEIEINDEGDILEVELTSTPEWQDDSFDYAGTHCTGGRSGTHHIPKYLSIADNDITWDKNEYTPEQNKAIERYIDNNADELDEQFCKQFKRENDESE